MVNFQELKEKNIAIADNARENHLIQHPGLPVRITVETTNQCNFRCKMCQTHRPIIPSQFEWEDFKPIIDEIFPTLSIFHPTTIGEPFCYSYFDEMIAALNRFNIKLDLTSNGSLLTPQRSAQILPLLEDIKISIDAAEPKLLEQIQLGVNWNILMKNLKNFTDQRKKMYPTRKTGDCPTLTLQMTIMKSNLNQLPKMVDLCGKVQADRFKAYHLFAFSESMNSESCMDIPEQYNDIFQKAFSLAKKKQIPAFLAEPFQTSDVINVNSSNSINSQPCPLLWHESWIILMEMCFRVPISP